MNHPIPQSFNNKGQPLVAINKIEINGLEHTIPNGYHVVPIIHGNMTAHELRDTRNQTKRIWYEHLS